MSKQCCDAQIFGEDEHTIDCEAPRIMTKKPSAPAPRLHSQQAPKEKKIEQIKLKHLRIMADLVNSIENPKIKKQLKEEITL